MRCGRPALPSAFIRVHRRALFLPSRPPKADQGMFFLSEPPCPQGGLFSPVMWHRFATGDVSRVCSRVGPSFAAEGRVAWPRGSCCGCLDRARAWPCSCATRGCRRTHAHAACMSCADTSTRAWAWHPRHYSLDPQTRSSHRRWSHAIGWVGPSFVADALVAGSRYGSSTGLASSRNRPTGMVTVSHLADRRAA